MTESVVQLPRFLLIKKIIREISLPIIAILTIYFGGALLISVHEGWDYVQALYFVLVTLTTIGYGDLTPTSPTSRYITMGIIILGVGVISLSINAIGNRIIKNSLNHDFRYEQAIKTTTDHIIIAGYSDVGKRIAVYISSWGIAIVIIDTSLDNVQAARDDGHIAIQGDISNPRELRKLNLDYARGLVLAIRDPDVTLISSKAALVFNDNLWVVGEAEVGVSKNMYRRAGMSAAIDRFSETKTKIRGILWGVEMQNFEFYMPDSIAFFSIPNFKLLTEKELSQHDFHILGLINRDEFYPYRDNEILFNYADYLLVAGPAPKTDELTKALKSHIPEDKDGVRRVLLVGYGKYAKSIMSSAIRNADEVYIVDSDEIARKEAKKDGRSQVDVRAHASKSILEIMDIIVLTSRAAGSMISLTLKAQEMNEDVKIYARAAIPEHISIFESAGAEYVFSPEVDCAAKLASHIIEYEFNAKSIPFKNGQLLFHSGDIKIRGVKERHVLASYREKDGQTINFGKLRRGKNSYNLEFVEFKQ